MTIGDGSMNEWEIRIGDMLIAEISQGAIRPEDVPKILANAALRALDETQSAFSIGSCPHQCCAMISVQPNHSYTRRALRVLRGEEQ